MNLSFENKMNILLNWINKNKKLPSCRTNSNEEFKLFIFYEFCINRFKDDHSDNTYFSIKQFKNLAILLIINNLDKDIRINGKKEIIEKWINEINNISKAVEVF
jgi:hypothetical protein